MVAVKYLVPYEAAIKGIDIKSGKPVNNILHMRSGVQLAGPPGYGADLAGSDLQLVADNVKVAWTVLGPPNGFIQDALSIDYLLQSITLRAITGWTTGGTPRPVQGASNASPIVILTLGDHNLRTGDSVVIAGCLGNTAANGTYTVTVVSPQSFSLSASVGNGLYLGGGTWQLSVVPPRLTYGDSALAGPAFSPNGGVVGEALPLVASGSMRKVTAASGRRSRGGMRTGPHAESQNINGKFTDAAFATVQAAATAFFTGPYANRLVPVAPQDFMLWGVFSRTNAITQATPFVNSTDIFKGCTSFPMNRNFGSMVRRKPKLNAPINV